MNLIFRLPILKTRSTLKTTKLELFGFSIWMKLAYLRNCRRIGHHKKSLQNYLQNYLRTKDK